MPSPENLHTTAPHLDQLRRQFLEAQLAGDRRRALDLISTAVTDHVRTRDLRMHVIGAAQKEIGRLWQENVIGMAGTHGDRHFPAGAG